MVSIAPSHWLIDGFPCSVMRLVNSRMLECVNEPCVIMLYMTRLLEEAINELRNLPEDEQDAAADALFAYISSDERQYQLRPGQIAEVHRIQRALRDGKTRLATDAEVSAFRKKSRL
jgi:hypothetical protein